MRLRSLLPAMLLAFPLLARNQVFRVDENHSVFGFKASTLLFDVPGRFMRYKVEVQGNPATFEGAKVRIDIDAKSINTAVAARDEHLRSKDFFDVGKYPKITFISNDVRREGNQVLVRGTLLMHGVSRDLDLRFVPAEGVNGAGVHTWSYRTTLTLDRLDYGVGAESVAAKISLGRPIDLTLLLVGFFEDGPPPSMNGTGTAKKSTPATRK